MKLIRVAIANGYPEFRKSLRIVIDHESDLVVVAEAEDGVAAIEMVENLKPDVVLMDVQLPLLDGIEATRIIKNKHPGTSVIMLSLLTDDGTRVKAMEAGASHYLSKAGHLKGMLNVIRNVHPQVDNKPSPDTAVAFETAQIDAIERSIRASRYR